MREIYLVVSILFSLQMKAQSVSSDVFASGGTTFSGATAIVDFTIGEPITQTFLQTPSNIIITQGFHQPEKQNTSIESARQLNISVFPNPTFQWVNIHLGDFGYQKFTVEVFDELGRTLFSSQFSGTEAQVDFSSFRNATYHLRILFSNYPMQHYTIIKQSNQ